MGSDWHRGGDRGPGWRLAVRTSKKLLEGRPSGTMVQAVVSYAHEQAPGDACRQWGGGERGEVSTCLQACMQEHDRRGLARAKA